MKSNAELKALAKKNLEGKWFLAIIVCVVAWLLTDALTGNGGRDTFDYVYRNGEFVKTIAHHNDSNSIFSLLAFIIGGPINFGLASFFLKLARNQETSFAELFSGFQYFVKNFLLNLFIIVFTILWFLLFVIPGFIAILKYSMAYYLMRDNTELKPLEAITLSKEIMNGQKMRLFFLWLSFIGWFMLGVITFGIGFLYVMPYFHATMTNFYEDIRLD